MKKKQESISTLIKKLTKGFNEYIRLRDQENGYFRCISCGQIKPVSQMHAGHFYPAGQYPALRFDERNVNGECVYCNYYSGDHLIGYRKNLIEKIGQKEVKDLDMIAAYWKSHTWKWDRMTLEYKIKEYKEKVKQLRQEKF